ncbi:MAG TPA: M15 family peptidase [bacterium]|nr:M15 family peptidase [bacterium]
MPYLSKRSEGKLITCREELQRICRSVIQYYDFAVIHGYRGRVIQNELYRQGFSKLKFPKSYHNKKLSEAVDLAPYPIDWRDTRRFDILAGRMLETADMMGLTLIWGGDWDNDDDLKDQTFNDLGHYQIILNY